MILKFYLGKWKVVITIAPTTFQTGVNSKLEDGNHILMWDFDSIDQLSVEDALIMVQETFHLPKIYLLETKKNKNFIAYCFKRVTFKKAIQIISSTWYVDEAFLRYGVCRNKFTLRVSKKGERKPVLANVLESTIPETATIPELKSWVRYETLADGYEPKPVIFSIEGKK